MKRITKTLCLAMLLASNTYGQVADKPVACELIKLFELATLNNQIVSSNKIQVERSLNNIQLEQSVFDPVLTSGLSLNRSNSFLNQFDPSRSVVGSNLLVNNFGLDVGVSKRFNTGTVVSSSINLTKVADNSPFSEFGQEVGTFVDNNSSQLFLQVTQPLLRGRGKSYNTNNLKFAENSLVISKLENVNNASQQFRSIVTAYWAYLADYQRIEIFRSNLERVQRVLDITKELVRASKSPESDLLQIRADVEDKKRQLIQARQSLTISKNILGNTIGLSRDDFSSISYPIDDFPSIDIHIPEVDLVIEFAMSHRADLQAVQTNTTGLALVEERLHQDLKPQLDLNMVVGYVGNNLNDGFHNVLTSLVSNDSKGVQLGLGVNYNFPIKNRQAEARLLDAQLAIDQQELLYRNFARNIEINITTQINNLVSARDAVIRSEEALRYYQSVFSNEEIKFKNGLSTILNLILFQERLTFAQLEYVSAQQQFATAIANLRYESGSLLSSNIQDGNFDLDKNVFYDLIILNK